MNPDKYSEIPKKSHDDKEQEDLQRAIIECIRNDEELPDEYIQNSLPTTLQTALKQGLVEHLQSGGWLLKKYSQFLKAETWTDIKENHQAEILQGFVLRIENGEDFITDLSRLATDETLKNIRENHQEEIQKGIILYAARREAFLEFYLKLAHEDTLQTALKQCLLNSFATGVSLPASCFTLTSEKTLADIKENYQPEIKSWILSRMAKKVNLPEKYVGLATGPNEQLALGYWLTNEINDGKSIPTKYLSAASEETLKNIRELNQKEIENGIKRYVKKNKNIPKYLKDLATNETLQASLERGCTHYTSMNITVPPYYLNLATPETRQHILASALTIYIEKGIAIPKHHSQLATPETLQLALRQSFVNSVKSGGYLSTSYYKQLTPESFRIIKEDHQADLKQKLILCVQQNQDFPADVLKLTMPETIEAALEQGFIWCIKNRRPISEYLSKTKDGTIQSALKQSFIGYVKNEVPIPKEYLDLATDETVRAVIEQVFVESLAEGKDLHKKYIDLLLTEGNIEPLLQQGLVKVVQEGRNPTGSQLDLVSEKTLLIFENEPVLREAACKLTGSFFNDPKEMEAEVKELLEEKDIEWIRRLVFDRTLLSIGAKIHTRRSEIGSALKRTGGFVAHGKDTCFVSNPVPNKFVLEIAIEALRRKLKGTLDQEAFFQACVPHRLPNEYCAIATITFLLTKANNVKYDKDVLRHNQQTAGLTIYDAGGNLDDKFYVPKVQRNDERKVSFKGRTDIVLCTNIEDLEKAHFILSLLVHASYEPVELKFKALGKKFVEEFKVILERFAHSEWLQHNFINANLDDVGKILIDIAQQREDVSKIINQYNAGVGLYASESGSDEGDEAEQIRQHLVSMKKRIDESFWFQIRSLVTRYENLIYPDGMYIDALSGEYH